MQVVSNEALEQNHGEDDVQILVVEYKYMGVHTNDYASNMDNRINAVREITLSSEIKMDDRKRVSLTGLKKLVSFSPEEFVMETNLGPLVLKGSNLEIVKLDTLEGDLNIKGKVILSGYDNDIYNKLLDIFLKAKV